MKMKSMKQLLGLSAGLIMIGLLSACVTNGNRMGMVTDKETGIMYGSSIERSLVTDATFYNNPTIKVKTRNTSGDHAFELKKFTDDLEKSYLEKGYIPTDDAGFGLLMDVNVLYSGHIQTAATSEYAFLGAGLGAIAGSASGAPYGGTTGAIGGASLGAVIGSHDTEDTYMIVTRVTFGEIKKWKKSKKRITFSRSEKIKNIDDPDEDKLIYKAGLKKAYTTDLAVYAGGRNVTQEEIVDKVKERIIYIIKDFI